MKSMKKIGLVLLFAVLFACDKFDKCDGVICFTPPPGFYLEIIDKESSENLYSIDNLNVNEISITGTNNEDVSISFINENNVNLINISDIGWIMGYHSYILKLSNDIEIIINIEMEERNSDCCTFYEVLQFEIEEYEFKRSIYSEIIKVKI